MKQLFILLPVFALMVFSGCDGAKKMTTAATGKNADGQTTVTDVFWSLVELDGKPIVQAPDDKMIYVKLNTKDNKLEGNGGCNSMFGKFELSSGEQIKMTVGSTKMACAGVKMDTENNFFKALSQADKYFITADTLRLWKENVSLAKFEAKFFTK